MILKNSELSSLIYKSCSLKKIGVSNLRIKTESRLLGKNRRRLREKTRKLMKLIWGRRFSIWLNMLVNLM